MINRRNVLLITGSVLWLAVFVSLYYVWDSRAKRLEAEIAQQNDETSDVGMSGAGSGNTTEDDDTGDGRIVPQLRLRTWSPDGLPDFKCVNQKNEAVSKSDLLGRPWVASFIFTRCTESCPKVVSQLRSLQTRLKDVPVRMVSISVQPEKDTPDVLLQYATNLGADPEKWQFLTGEPDEIYRLVAGGFVQRVGPSTSTDPGKAMIHTNNVCLVNSKGVVISQFDSLDDADMLKLRKEIQRLIAEPDENKDPSSGDSAT